MDKKEKHLQGDKKFSYLTESALAGGLLYGVAGPVVGAMALFLLIFISIVTTPLTKNRLINIGLRALAFLLGAVIVHIFIYLRLRYNF